MVYPPISRSKTLMLMKMKYKNAFCTRLQSAFFCPKGSDNMDRTELCERLKKHLEFLEKAAENAAGLDRYSEAAELSKQILETVKLLDEYS